MPREPREQLLLHLLRDNWDASNTLGVTPDISFGWFRDEADQPQAAVGQPEESPLGGGETGYSHISPDGRPGQTLAGTIDIHVWSTPQRLEAQGASTNNPRQFNERCCEEIQRIISNHASRPVNPDSGNQPVDVLAYDGRAPAPEPDYDDRFHYIATAAYGYDD